jgi:tetratricopeptide (TPR) repeat protein
MWEELLVLDPNVAEAYNQIGYYYGYRGDYDKAMEYLKKYQFIAPDSANPFDSLGENQAYSGRYTEAIENLNRALAIKADFAPAYEHLGVAYEGLGEQAKAIESYRKAVELSGVDERGKYLGEALRAAVMADDRAAAVEFQAVRSKQPKSPYDEVRTALMQAAVALVEGHPLEAEKQLAELQPKLEKIWRDEHKGASDVAYFPEVNALMAMAKQRQGKTEEAMKLWEANANPPRPFADFDQRRWIIEGRAHLAALLAKKGDLDKAEKLIAENRKWNPTWAPCRESEATVAELRRTKVLAAAK